jgi:hypothetical protein
LSYNDRQTRERTINGRVNIIIIKMTGSLDGWRNEWMDAFLINSIIVINMGRKRGREPMELEI